MTSLLLVGAGKMGGALLARWRETRAAGIADFFVIDPAAQEQNIYASLEQLPADAFPSVIVFAVKPQSLAEILPAYKLRFGNKPLYLSIAAGKSTEFFYRHLGNEARIVRAMPNLPALIGEGISVLYAGAGIPAADKKTAASLMAAAGKVAWVEDESLMHAVTAVSGSGPAYVFLFLEALTKAGVAAGLPEAMAKSLAAEMVSGSASLAAKSPEGFEQLRINVTSPGGTTEAALSVLMQASGLEALAKEAVLAAKKRSEELNK